jgi:hypothetical protein
MKSLIHRSAKLSFLSVSALALFLNACVGSAVVGEENDSADGGDGDGDTGVTYNNDFGDLAGTRWEGYFEDGVDVTLVFGRDGAGSILYGEDLRLAPPTDPDAGYFCEWNDSYFEDSCSVSELREGWSYPVVDAEVSGRRVEFKVPGADPWIEWCALQTPRFYQENSDGMRFYGVGSGSRGNDEEGCYMLVSQDEDDKEYVDCDWYILAMDEPVCVCDENACEAETGSTSFDLTANSDFTELSNADGLHLFLVE